MLALGLQSSFNRDWPEKQKGVLECDGSLENELLRCSKKKGKGIYISLNRPEKRNAFHPDMIKQLKKLFIEVDCDSDLQFVYLNGNGSSFCVGADLV